MEICKPPVNETIGSYQIHHLKDRCRDPYNLSLKVTLVLKHKTDIKLPHGVEARMAQSEYNYTCIGMWGPKLHHKQFITVSNSSVVC